MHKQHAGRWPAAIVYGEKVWSPNPKPATQNIYTTSCFIPQSEFTDDREGINKRISCNQNPKENIVYHTYF
jgi:hypothetical protein